MGLSDRVLKILSNANVQELFENVDIEVSDLDVGKSGSAGTIDIFPATAAKGKLRLTCADQTGDTVVTLTTAAFSAARTITIPDPGADAEMVLTKATQTITAAKTFSGGLVLDSTPALALSITGTPTTAGLSITGTFASGQAMRIGTGISTPVTFAGNELVEWHGRLGSATSQNPLLRCRCSAPASTAMTTGSVVAGQFQAYGTDTSDISGLNAVQGHVGIKADSTIIADPGALPAMTAGWFKIEDLGFDLTLTGDAAALVLGMQFNAGTTLTGVADFIFLMKEGGLTGAGGVPDAIIRGLDATGGGLANFLLDIPASLPFDAANSSGTQSGKIAVNIGGATKYIQTYSD